MCRPISESFTKSKNPSNEHGSVRRPLPRQSESNEARYILEHTFAAIAGDASSLHGLPMMYRRIHRQAGGFRTSIVVAFCDADVRGCRRAAVGAAGAPPGSSCLFFVIMTLQAWKFIQNFRAGPLNV